MKERDLNLGTIHVRLALYHLGHTPVPREMLCHTKGDDE